MTLDALALATHGEPDWDEPKSIVDDLNDIANDMKWINVATPEDAGQDIYDIIDRIDKVISRINRERNSPGG